jgi:hypothetical protein
MPQREGRIVAYLLNTKLMFIILGVQISKLRQWAIYGETYRDPSY